MNLLKLFTSGSKTVDTVTDGIVNGVDKIFYTEEEKAIAKAKWFDTWMELQKTIANESVPTAISRRILAFMIMGPFVGMIVFSVVIYKFDTLWADFIINHGVKELSLLAGAVGATYFIKDAVVKSIQANKE